MIRALPDFERSDLFTPAEKAMLQFTECMATDHRSAPWDAVRERLGKYYTQAQIMAIGWRAAIFVGYGRLVFFTGLESVGAPCPVSFEPKTG